MKREVTKTVHQCDLCQRENLSSLLDKCLVCGRDFCSLCKARFIGCVVAAEVCEKCDTEALSGKMATWGDRIREMVEQRDKELFPKPAARKGRPK